MRVIAGRAGGIRLAVPKRGVRPTMDRVKGAIFSSLGDGVIGARVLDLFAGSGALGIEALSRGASSAIFVEEDQQSADIIESNLGKTKLTGRVRQQDVFHFLRNSSDVEKFQIIFADPPYEKTKSGENLLEKRPGESLPEIKLWRVTRQKTYGATEVLFLCQSDARTRRTPKALRAKLLKR